MEKNDYTTIDFQVEYFILTAEPPYEPIYDDMEWKEANRDGSSTLKKHSNNNTNSANNNYAMIWRVNTSMN